MTGEERSHSEWRWLSLGGLTSFPLWPQLSPASPRTPASDGMHIAGARDVWQSCHRCKHVCGKSSHCGKQRWEDRRNGGKWRGGGGAGGSTLEWQLIQVGDSCLTVMEETPSLCPYSRCYSLLLAQSLYCSTADVLWPDSHYSTEHWTHRLNLGHKAVNPLVHQLPLNTHTHARAAVTSPHTIWPPKAGLSNPSGRMGSPSAGLHVNRARAAQERAARLHSAPLKLTTSFPRSLFHLQYSNDLSGAVLLDEPPSVQSPELVHLQHLSGLCLVSLALLVCSVLHLSENALWALSFCCCGCITAMRTAALHLSCPTSLVFMCFPGLTDRP